MGLVTEDPHGRRSVSKHQGHGGGALAAVKFGVADDRILRGIMQLLQNHALVSWSLPKEWRIVLTANPDGTDYSVTPMDDAMITRMRHITMTFDVVSWSRWAEANGVDGRGITFVLAYPELATGQRTTPRTLVQFFESIEGIQDLKGQLPRVKRLADAVLDPEATAAFLAFVKNDLATLITPQEILESPYSKTEKELHKLTEKSGLTRVDILGTLCTRLSNYLAVHPGKLPKAALINLGKFLCWSALPADLRLTFAQSLTREPKVLSQLAKDPALAKLILSHR